jgi:hypothetical protein
MSERKPMGLAAAGLALAAAAAVAGPGSLDFGTSSRNAQATAEMTLELPPGKLHAATLCLDGHLFAVTTVLGHGSTAAAPAVAVTQVYTQRDGRSLPATCRPSSNP